MLALPRSHAGGDCTSERSSCLPQREERIASRAEAVVHLLKVLQRFPGRGHHLVGPPQRRRRRTRRLRAAPHRAAADFPGQAICAGCRLARLRASRARLMAACHFRSHFSNIGPARSRNPVRQLPSVTVEELSSIFGLARTRKLRWRREHFDVGAAGGEQKAAQQLLSAGGADVKMFSAPPTALHAG